MKNTWAILVAGGVGNRFGGKVPKQFLPLAGKRMIDYSLEVFSSIQDLGGRVLVLPAAYVEEWRERVRTDYPGFQVVAGGETRQQSVQQGLQAVGEAGQWILVHDVARPMVTEDLIYRCLEGAQGSGASVVAIPVADTLKKGNADQLVEETVSRDGFFRVQTPQGFSKKRLKEALDWAQGQGLDATDEATLVEKMGHPVRIVEGSLFNFKVTREEDLELAEALIHQRRGSAMKNDIRIGQGYDVHPFVEGRELILGGVKIPFEMGLQGHSDADALLHAISDALLGAVAEGDLGAHFPDSDPQYRGASSMDILKKVADLIGKKGFRPLNVDATVVCQSPKLAPFIPSMRENIARVLAVDLDQVSVKATTEEGLGFTGKQEGLTAKAVVLVQR